MSTTQSSNPIPSVVTSFHDGASTEERPTTPPNTSTVPPEGTPLTGKLASSLAFTSTHLDPDKRVTAMQFEIAGRIVGPISAQEFLDRYLPQASFPSAPERPDHKGPMTELAQEMSGATREIQMYDKWNNKFNEFCEPGNLKLHNVASRPAPDFYEKNIKPDLGLYSSDLSLTDNSDIIEEAEILHECKYSPSDDPFNDEDPSFERDTEKACDTLGQITLYATAHMAAQFRTHIFSLLILPKYARLLRWDRAGVVVTEEIPIDGSESALAEFYWRYSHATPDVRGHDTTVERVLNRVEAEAARKRLNTKVGEKLFRLKLGENGYIVGKPTYMGMSSPTGRSTRAFTAYCEQDKKLVFMKDTWRVVISGQLPEHEIYEKLHKNNVRNIAQLIKGADILDHKTITHEATEIFPNKDLLTIRKFRHYRLALKDVGHDLRSFSSVKQLVKVIRDATIAHDDAFFKAGVLHRDISTGNIIYLEGGRGLLVDWDLCKVMNSSEDGDRAIERTGTWQFAAARLLLSKPNQSPHDREDDLESFYHVLNWMALRHTSHTLDAQSLTSELQRIFDYVFRSQSGRAAGGMTKIAEILSGTCNKFAAFKNQPLAELLETIRTLVSVRYQEPDRKVVQPVSDHYQNKLRQPEEFTSLFTNVLMNDQNWDANGTRVDHQLVNLDARTEKKRKANITQLHRPGPIDDDEHSAKRSKKASDDGA